ncbi:2-methoxy-6-polyprenyl-1,4-benzoquinol methylase [subsurface metagenome]
MLENARGRFEGRKNVDVRTEDCYCTSFDDGSFDAILIANVLHIVDSPDEVMKEAFRVLKPGGNAVVVDYTGCGMSLFPMLALAFRYIRRWGWPPSSGKPLGPKELAALAEGAGFVVEESVLLGRKTKAACMRARKVSLSSTERGRVAQEGARQG